MVNRSLALVLVLASLVSGCSSVRNLLGFPSPGDPSVTLRTSESRWLLVKNPRFGDVPSEPEYIWVEEDKRPWLIKWGVPQRAAIAPPEIAAKYGSPPGGGKMSPKQGLPYQTATSRTSAATGPDGRGAQPPKAGAAPGTVGKPGTDGAAPGPAADLPKRGYVVWLDTSRVVVDLTSQDGLKPGAVVSLRRDKIPIVHPVTGELLGELDEEVATARIVETRDKFSVGEIQSVTPGMQVQLQDRVVPK
jgi:hypothetical protein